MSRKFELKGIIFDYGGTIDTNSRHWAEVLWEKYQLFQVPVTKEAPVDSKTLHMHCLK